MRANTHTSVFSNNKASKFDIINSLENSYTFIQQNIFMNECYFIFSLWL